MNHTERVNEVLNKWHLDITGKKEFDLASILYVLCDRGATVVLPKYKSSSSTNVHKAGEMVISDNRHGKIKALVSSKDNMGFSIKVVDQNVITTDSTGADRNFRMVNPDGSFYTGWEAGIEFLPTDSETATLQQDIENGKIVLDNFIHPNRWVSFYGQPYYNAKVLIAQMTHRKDFLRAEMKRIKASITLPETPVQEYVKTASSTDVEKVKVPVLEVEVEGVEFETYAPIEATLEAYNAAKSEANLLSYVLIPKVQFMTRVTELAFMQYGFHADGTEKKAAWVNGNEWQREYKQEGKRVKWNKIAFNGGKQIIYRVVEKTVEKAK